MSELRRWKFLAEDWNYESFYLDAAGQPTTHGCEEFVGDDLAASREADNRVYLYDDDHYWPIAKVTMESQGKEKERFYE